MSLNYKICHKCNNNLPLTQEYFSKHIRTKSGFHNLCKICRAKDAREYRQNNPDKYKESRLKNYAKHKDKYNANRLLKYHNDPEYRTKKIARDLKYRESGARKKENRSEESWKKHLESAARARKKNPERTIQYNNYYRKIKGDLVITMQRKQRAELSDSYIKQVIQKGLRDDGVFISRSEIPMDFIELKRKQLNIYRDVKNKKN